LSTFGYGIAITRRRQAVSHAGVPSEFAHQTAYRLKEFMRQLDSSIINSIRSDTEGGAADYSSMGGIIEFISATDGNITTTSEALTPSVMNAMIKQIWDDGGMVAGGRLACIVGGVQKRKISAFDQAYRRLDYESRAAGYVVEKFLSDLGFEVEIIVDPHVPDDICVIGDLTRLKVGPLQTMAVSLEDIAKTGALIEAMLTGKNIIASLKLRKFGENLKNYFKTIPSQVRFLTERCNDFIRRIVSSLQLRESLNPMAT